MPPFLKDSVVCHRKCYQRTVRFLLGQKRVAGVWTASPPAFGRFGLNPVLAVEVKLFQNRGAVMFCVTSDGIRANAEMRKSGDPKDAQVLAHLEDLENALHAAKEDQIDDLMEDPDDLNDAQVLSHIEDACSSVH